MAKIITQQSIFNYTNIEELNSFIRECNRNSQLRQACGLCDSVRKKNLVPKARVFSGFIKNLFKFQEEVEQIFKNQVNSLFQLSEILLKVSLE